MKDYDRYVVWLEYFNSELKRSEGRRVPLSLATRGPRLEELVQACSNLDLSPKPEDARYPRAVWRQSGYVSVKKSKPKQALVVRIAKELSSVRGRDQKSRER